MGGSWKHKIDMRDLWKQIEVFEEQGKSTDEIALEFGGKVAAVIRASEPYGKYKTVLEPICQDLEEADCEDAFDYALDGLYDWADRNKTCWVGTVV